MASLMDRIRDALGVNSEHTQEHADVRAELTEQRVRIRRLDAYVESRSGRDRRKLMTPSHPNRRVTDV